MQRESKRRLLWRHIQSSVHVVSLRAVYVSGQYGVIFLANFLKEKEGLKLKVYNNIEYYRQ
jgi:hypothetical protein